jgi:acetyl esterase/lipase
MRWSIRTSAMTPEKSVRTYRVLFYLAVLAGFVSAFQTWRARQSQMVIHLLVATPEQEKGPLTQARAGFKTKLVPRSAPREPVPEPPPEVFRKVYYESPVGKLAAYLSQVPDDGVKRPAIIWIRGGRDCNSIKVVWDEMPASNDQNATAYRKAGIVMMFPSLRGGNDNPGIKECFLGEVDDIIAAADYLAREQSVDPKRIYLGGHSTGGTLVLLVAESTDRFRAVFSFAPVSDVAAYEAKFIIPFDTSNPREVELRSPGRWLLSIRGPTFVFEGTDLTGNIGFLEAMSRASTNPRVHFLPVKGADHLTTLAPTNALIARKILGDVGSTTNIGFTEEELYQPFAR